MTHKVDLMRSFSNLKGRKRMKVKMDKMERNMRYTAKSAKQINTFSCVVITGIDRPATDVKIRSENSSIVTENESTRVRENARVGENAGDSINLYICLCQYRRGKMGNDLRNVYPVRYNHKYVEI